MTPFSDLFLGARVNNMYTSRNSNVASPVFVNLTVLLSESPETLRASVKQDLQKHLMGVIQRRSNNVGASALWVDAPSGAVSQIHGKYTRMYLHPRENRVLYKYDSATYSSLRQKKRGNM